jgi:hypothetical protein
MTNKRPSDACGYMWVRKKMKERLSALYDSSPASAPENADSSKPSVPTPTWILLPSPNIFELLIKSDIVPAAKSNTRNLVTANGSSRDTIGLNDSHRGLISSTCSPKSIAGLDDNDELAPMGFLFCLFCSCNPIEASQQQVMHQSSKSEPKSLPPNQKRPL